MPAGNANGNNFTFNKSTEVDVGVGYYSRVLYTFVPCKSGFNGDVSGFEEWASNATGNVLQILATDSNYAGCSHGSIDIPVGYWKQGKTIRIKGTLICTAESTNQILNLGFGLYNITDATYDGLGTQYNGTNHTFADGAAAGPLPVNFEFVISCYNSTNVWAYGFYTYDQTNYSSQGENDGPSIKYVPVWNGGALANTSNLFTTQTRISMNGFGSTVSTAFLTNLIIEELA